MLRRSEKRPDNPACNLRHDHRHTATEQLNDVTSGSNSVGSAGPRSEPVTDRGPRPADHVYEALVCN